MKSIYNFILFNFILSTIFSQNIIVDNSKDYNVTNQYAKFDRYTKHGGFDNYKYENKDRISLPENFPVLGSTFTLEAMTFTADISFGQHQKVIGSENWNPR
jgi:hypothetical protein